MTVSTDGERPKVKLGECELDVSSSGSDAFKVLGPTFDGAAFTFVVSPDGKVTAVRLERQKESLIFARG